MSASCSMKMYISKILYQSNHKSFTHNSVHNDGSKNQSNNDNYEFKTYNLQKKR